MRNAESHINELFFQRAKNDLNSVTLANTLDKDIETVFNSPEKFVFELLQNADDASLVDHENEVSFCVKGSTLLFSHQGKPFDADDVDAICDNAQHNLGGKRADIEKIGYKGIGFKSVFVVASRVCIVSGDYSFRFDQHYSQWQKTTGSRAYPWQIIPIWTPTQARMANFQLDKKRVNFLLSLRPSLDVGKTFGSILNDSNLLLFLRRVSKLHFEINGQVKTIERIREKNHCLIYIDRQVSSRWFMTNYVVQVPDVLRQKMEKMGTHECPEKLKRIKSTQVTFAAKIIDQEIKALIGSPLYCYLPTTMESGFPFLVNGDFLLNADRMQLLRNDWNIFLFKVIAFYHINFLAELTQQGDYYKQVLALFISMLSFYSPSWAVSAYSLGVDAGLKEIAFIPSKNFALLKKSDALLRYEEAISDDLGFFSQFSGIDSQYESRLVANELKDKKKLKHHFGFKELIFKLEIYAERLKSIRLQQSLIRFLFQNQDVRYLSELSSKAFLLSDKQILLPPNHLSVLGSCQITEFPDCLSLSWLNRDLLLSLTEKEVEWLQKLGVKSFSDQNLLEKIFETIDRSLWDVNFSNETAQMFLKLLYIIYFKSNENKITDWKFSRVFGKFPFVTQAGNVKQAQKCYLPSYLEPKFDLQKIVSEPELFIGENYKRDYDLKKLRVLLKKLGVRSNIKLEIKKIFTNSCSRYRIDGYKEYIDYLSKIDKVWFFGGHYQINGFAFIDFMRFLEHPDYATHFWSKLTTQSESLVETFKNVSVLVRSNKHTRIFPATHYLNFMLSRTECIQGDDGRYYKANQLYNPYLFANLDKSLQNFLKPIASRIQAGVLIPQPLFTVFGFKNEFTFSDYLKLFKKIIDEDEVSKRQARLQTVCRWLINATFSEEEKLLLRQSPIKLLASDGELRFVTTLFYLQKPESFQYLLNTLDSSSAYFVKDLPDLGLKGMDKLSEIFALRCLSVEFAEVEYQCGQDSAVIEIYTQQFRELLKYAVQSLFYRTPENKREFDLKQYYKNFDAKFQEITFVNVQSCSLTWLVEGSASLAFEMLLLKKVFYLKCGNSRSFEYFIKAVGNFIDLDRAAIEKMLYLSRDTEQVRRERLREEGFDVDEILTIDDVVGQLVLSTTVHSSLSRRLEPDSLASSSSGQEIESELIQPQFLPANINYDEISFKRTTVRLKESILSPTVPLSQINKNEVIGLKKQVRQKSTDENFSPVSAGDISAWSGRWGEEITFGKLRNHYQLKYSDSLFNETEVGFTLTGGKLLSQLEVTWVNKQVESGLPYDFKVIKGSAERYIEVKSTYHEAGQNIVRVSGAEWKLMKKAGDRYRLFYVTNAGTQLASIQKIKNPAREISDGELVIKEIHLKI